MARYQQSDTRQTTETKTPYGIIYRSGNREWFAGSQEEFETAKHWELRTAKREVAK